MDEPGYFSLSSLTQFFNPSDGYSNTNITFKEAEQLFQSRSESKTKDAMKKIICMIQRGMECGEFFESVLKISDTNCLELKEMVNWYFLNYSKNISVETIFNFTTNTIIKDLNGSNEEIRQCALRFLISLSPLEQFSNFVESVTKVLREGSDVSKCLVLKLFENFVGIEPNFICSYDLVTDVFEAFNSHSMQVFTHALKCVNKKTFSYLKMDLIMGFVERFQSVNVDGVSIKGYSALCDFVVDNKKLFTGDQQKKFIKIFTMTLSSSFYYAYYSAVTILRICPEMHQEVFEKMAVFLYLKNEELLFLLQLLLSILVKFTISYNNNLFTIFEDDSKQIKQVKLEILKLKCDSFTINEVLNRKEPEFVVDSLKFSMKYGIFNHEIFKICYSKYFDDFKRSVCYYKPDSEDWRIAISTGFEIRDNSLETLYIVSNYFFDVPEIEFNDDYSSTIRFYVRFYLRSVIDFETLKETLKKLGKCNSGLNNEANLILNMIKTNRNAVAQYCEYEIFGEKTKKTVYLFDKKYESIEKLRPFVDGLETCNQSDLTEIEAIRSNYSLIKVGQSGKELPTVENKILLKSLTNICFTAKVLLSGNDVELKVETINKPFNVTSNLQNAEELRICSSDIYKIGEIYTPTSFNIKVNGLYGYQINVNVLKCVELVEIDEKDFMENFNSLVEYLVIDRNFFIGQTGKYFAFKMLNEMFFCKEIDNRIIVKGKNRECLSFLAKK